MLLAVCAGDTAAFFGGRLVGRHKLAPPISPGKTWEGFVGRDVAAVLVAFFALYEPQDFLSIRQSLVLGARDRGRRAARRPVRVAQARLGRQGHGRLLLAATAAMLDRLDALLSRCRRVLRSALT